MKYMATIWQQKISKSE